MLITASRTAPRERALQTRRAAVLACATCQQRRGLRFGPWASSHTDSDLHREARRRHRNFRYRYMESLNRKLSWDNQPRSDDTKEAIKKAMAHFIHSSGTPPAANQYVDIEQDIKSWSDDVSGLRPGRNIEDVEREAINHLFESGKHGKYSYELWKSPLSNIRKYIQTQRAPKEVTPEEVLHATTSVHADDNAIDPVTNRKVSKEGSAHASQSSTGTTYSSATENTSNSASLFTPKFEDVDHLPNLQSKPFPTGTTLSTTPKKGQVDRYGPVKWNEPDGLRKSTPEEESKKYDDLDKYTPKVDNPNAPPKRTPEEESKRYKDLDKYTPEVDNPDALPKRTPEEESKRYKDLDKYKPAKWNEPDGLQKPTPEEESKKYSDLNRYTPTDTDDPNAPRKLTPEEKSKQYKDLGSYNAVTWNEPDGLRELTLEERSKEYTDLHSYGAVRWNEPDGLSDPTPEELSKNYDDIGSYGSVQWNEPDGLRKLTPEELSKEYADLQSYGAVRWNEPDGLRKLTPEELSKNYDDLRKYGPVKWNEPDGLRKLTPEELSKSYQDVGEYKPVTWNEPDGLRRLTPEEESKGYGDLRSYDGPQTAMDSVIEAHETAKMDATPKGQPLQPKVEVPFQDPGKEYKDLKEYGPVKWNEPDGLRKLTPEELSKNYDDLHFYGAIRWNEPDGLRTLTPEEKSKQYEDVQKYAPTGSTGPEQVPVRRHPEEASKDYEDLDSYGPVRWNEPDGLRNLTPEEESKKYSDLAGYAPKGLLDPKGKPVRRHPEEASKDYKDLDKYARFENGDPVSPREHPEEVSKRYEDLDKYATRGFDSGDRKYPVHPETASKEYKDLSRYEFSGVKGAEKTQHIHPEELSKNYNDLDKYNPQKFDSTSRTYPTHPEEASKNYQDLGSYNSSLYNEPDGLPKSQADSVEQSLASYDEKMQAQQQQMASAETYRGRSNNTSGSAGDDGSDKFGSLTAEEIRANVVRRAKENSKKHRLDKAKAHYRSTWDPVIKEAQQGLEKKTKIPLRTSQDSEKQMLEDARAQYRSTWDPVVQEAQAKLEKDRAKPPRIRAHGSNHTLQDAKAHYRSTWEPILKEAHEKLEQDRTNPLRRFTGDHARDFPEDLNTPWNITKPSSKSALYPKDKSEYAGKAESGQREGPEASSMDESFPSEPSKLEPSLNRQACEKSSGLSASELVQAQKDPYSKVPQGLETSYAEECGGVPTWPTLVKHYGSNTQKAQEKTSTVPEAETKEPMGYKMLAYDPATDSIRAAETSSAVLDVSSPMTPADVVLRLSNPAKFFPYFSSLQAEGYEMVSGQGDVLVFRKVRPASPDATPTVTETGPTHPAPVNPVDMMGKPVTGNFASPTGFVNYDTLPEEKESKPAPPFRSNIDVQNGEPVFRKKESEGNKGKKGGFGKKMLMGTAGLGAAAYTAGVVAEYFATSGGPMGP